MKHHPWFLALFALVLALSGCAHPISLAGNPSALVGTGKVKVAKAAGLVISEEDRKREVVGPGGGGDKVRYFPVRDIETGLYVALSESFSRVVRVDRLNDPKIAAEGLSYLITPSVATTSFSPSLLTWPPTIFTVELTCKVLDAGGNPITEVRAFGEGRAEFDDFRSDPSMAAKRATDDALRKLISALADRSAVLK